MSPTVKPFEFEPVHPTYEQLEARLGKVVEAAQKVVKAQWQHRCPDKVGGCTAVSESALAALAAELGKP